MVTDPIADMFTRIRNAIRNGKEEVFVPHSRLKTDITRLLKEEGFIRFFEVIDQKNRF